MMRDQRLRLPIFAMISAILTIGAMNTALAASDSKQPPALALSMVFDGSGSMCSYFLPNDQQRLLLSLIKQAMIMRNPDSGIQVLTLRQKNKTKVSASADLVPVAANFQAQAEILAQLGKTSAGGCSPFDGIGSNLELIFDTQANIVNSKAIVLVTDAQIKEADRDVFLNGYQSWAAQAIKEGKVPYAGYVLAQTGFEGTYYSIAEPDSQLRATGYKLPRHSRPLALFWFAKGEDQLASITTLANIFGKSQTIVQQLLPTVQAIALPLKIQPFVSSASLEQLLVNSGQLTKVQLFDNSRSEKVILPCVKSSIQMDNKILQLQAQLTCADTRPLWDGVTSVKYGMQLKSMAPSIQYKIDGWTYNEKSKNFELTIDRQFKEKSFNIIPSLSQNQEDGRISLMNWSVDSDFCPKTNDGQKACLAQLHGKTYQLDTLSQQLVSRSRSALQMLLEPVAKATFQIKMDYKK